MVATNDFKMLDVDTIRRMPGSSSMNHMHCIPPTAVFRQRRNGPGGALKLQHPEQQSELREQFAPSTTQLPVVLVTDATPQIKRAMVSKSWINISGSSFFQQTFVLRCRRAEALVE